MIYRFGIFDVDLKQFEIRVAGQLAVIEPKVFNLIVYLIQHRGRLVSRDELFEQVWHGREVSDTTLSNHIKSARKVLGDNGNNQHGDQGKRQKIIRKPFPIGHCLSKINIKPTN